MSFVPTVTISLEEFNSMKSSISDLESEVRKTLEAIKDVFQVDEKELARRHNAIVESKSRQAISELYMKGRI